jgi:toxin ParE1/3/4
VAEGGGRARLVLAPSARSDIHAALIWSRERFGERAAERYRDLIEQALRDIVADPERPGSSERPDLARGVRAYHLMFSRDRARGPSGVVRRPRHFLVYRRRDENVIDVVRVLHDARELDRHMPDEYRSDPERFGPE